MFVVSEVVSFQIRSGVVELSESSVDSTVSKHINGSTLTFKLTYCRQSYRIQTDFVRYMGLY